MPIFPIPSLELAVAKKSNPGQNYYNNKKLPIPSVQDLPEKEKKQLILQLVNKTLLSFIQTISPYRVKVNAEIATGGKADTVNFLKEGKTERVRKLIEKIPENERDSADWYNLGLAYEASAISPEDYEDATEKFKHFDEQVDLKETTTEEEEFRKWDGIEEDWEDFNKKEEEK